MKKETQFKYLIGKLIVFTILAVLVYVFRDKQIEHLKPFIGSLMVLYGVDGILFEVLVYRKNFFQQNKVYLGLVELIFGIVLIASSLEFDYVCIIWATWSIVRESYEIKEVVSDIKMIFPKVLSGVESIVVIVFSILLLLDPGEHHALIHMALLTAELILNPLVIIIDEALIYWREKKQANKEQE